MEAVEKEKTKEPEETKETQETPETNEVSTPEDLEAIKAQLEEEKTKAGLHKEAFAIVSDPEDPETWKLPHHTRTTFRALQGQLDIDKTVNWYRMPAAVAALSRGGYREERVRASEEDIIEAARHLAGHYEKAGKSVPDTLGALI